VCTGQWNRQFCKCPNQNDDKCKWLFSLLSCLLLVSCVVNFMSQQVECAFKCGKGAATTTTTTTVPQRLHSLNVLGSLFSFFLLFFLFDCHTENMRLLRTYKCLLWMSTCVCVSELMCVLHNVLKNK